MTNPIPTECKDLAFARNLIAQMKGEGGRHNSTVSPARVSGTPAGGVVVAQEPVAPMAKPQSGTVNHHHLRFLQQATDPRVTLADMERWHAAQGNCEMTATEIRRRWYEFSEALVPFNSLAIIGNWGNNFIMRAADYCEIGDVCRYAAIAAPEGHDAVRLTNTQEPDIKMTFKKVPTMMTRDDGHTFQTEYFWERVE